MRQVLYEGCFWFVENNKRYIPVEVKWTERPTMQDAKHLLKFMEEYDCDKNGFIICRSSKPLLLSENIIALPWEELAKVISV